MVADAGVAAALASLAVSKEASTLSNIADVEECDGAQGDVTSPSDGDDVPRSALHSYNVKPAIESTEAMQSRKSLMKRKAEECSFPENVTLSQMRATAKKKAHKEQSQGDGVAPKVVDDTEKGTLARKPVPPLNPSSPSLRNKPCACKKMTS